MKTIAELKLEMDFADLKNSWKWRIFILILNYPQL